MKTEGAGESQEQQGQRHGRSGLRIKGEAGRPGRTPDPEKEPSNGERTETGGNWLGEQGARRACSPQQGGGTGGRALTATETETGSEGLRGLLGWSCPGGQP